MIKPVLVSLLGSALVLSASAFQTPSPLRFNRDLSVASTPGAGLQYDKSKLAKDPNSANFRKLSDAMARVEKEAKRNEMEKQESEEAERKKKEARERRIATLNTVLQDPDKSVREKKNFLHLCS